MASTGIVEDRVFDGGNEGNLLKLYAMVARLRSKSA